MARGPGVAAVCSRELHTLRQAAEELLEVMQTMQLRGRNAVTELLDDAAPMLEWQHYPADDATDPVSGYRWYYHSHADTQRADEHGHFHVFASAAGAGYTHLVALSMSATGLPLRAFTTNRWVTNEVYAPARRVLSQVRRFAMGRPRQLLLVHRWLGAMLSLFRPQIGWLLEQRDRRLEAASARRPNVFEDRRTKLLSQCSLDLPAQFAWLEGSSPLKNRTGVC
jgi:hypothetical protein